MLTATARFTIPPAAALKILQRGGRLSVIRRNVSGKIICVFALCAVLLPAQPNCPADAATVQAIKSAAAKIASLSGERRQTEFMKILALAEVEKAVNFLAGSVRLKPLCEMKVARVTGYVI